MKLRPWSLMALLIMVGIMVGGCGYAYYTQTNYFYPDWTPDGKIICIKEVIRLKESLGGPYPGHTYTSTMSKQYYIVIMDIDGNNEQNIKEIQGVNEVHMSPGGHFIAYAEENTIKMIDSNGQNKSSINIVGDLGSFDWSPNEEYLVYDVYLNSTREGFIVRRDGPQVANIHDYMYGVRWRCGDNVIYSGLDSTKSYSFNSSILTAYPRIGGGDFNVNPSNTNEVIYRGTTSNGIGIFSLNNTSSEAVELIARNDIWHIHLSPDGNKIIGSGIRTQELSGSEIWLINIDGSGLNRLR